MFYKLTPEKINKWEKERLVKKLVKAKAKERKDESLSNLIDEALDRILESCYGNLGSLVENKTKENAITTIGIIKDRRAANRLRSAWYSCTGPVRIAVVRALGELRDEKAVDKIKKDLYHATWGADRSGKLRNEARRALKRIGTPEALAVLNQYKAMLLSEAEASRKGMIFKCPYCGKSVSRHTLACPKCRGIMKK